MKSEICEKKSRLWDAVNLCICQFVAQSHTQKSESAKCKIQNAKMQTMQNAKNGKMQKCKMQNVKMSKAKCQNVKMSESVTVGLWAHLEGRSRTTSTHTLTLSQELVGREGCHCPHSLTAHSLTLSLTHPLTHSPTSHTHTHTHTLTCSLTPPTHSPAHSADQLRSALSAVTVSQCRTHCGNELAS